MDVRISEEIVESGAEGVISVWLFRSGETVARGDVLAEVMNSKAVIQLEAPASGTLTILTRVEVPVRCGDVIARID